MVARGDLEVYGIPNEGALYRSHLGTFWVTGPVHRLWSTLGYEEGELGAPTSNFDPERGVQHFEKGTIIFNGHFFEQASSSDAGKPFYDLKPAPESIPE